MFTKWLWCAYLFYLSLSVLFCMWSSYLSGPWCCWLTSSWSFALSTCGPFGFYCAVSTTLLNIKGWYVKFYLIITHFLKYFKRFKWHFISSHKLLLLIYSIDLQDILAFLLFTPHFCFLIFLLIFRCIFELCIISLSNILTLA